MISTFTDACTPLKSSWRDEYQLFLVLAQLRSLSPWRSGSRIGGLLFVMACMACLPLHAADTRDALLEQATAH
jgi:hypothetical protein